MRTRRFLALMLFAFQSFSLAACKDVKVNIKLKGKESSNFPTGMEINGATANLSGSGINLKARVEMKPTASTHLSGGGITLSSGVVR